LAVLVGTEIFHHENIYCFEGGQQNIAHISTKNFRIDGSLDCHAGSAVILSGRADHGGGAPAATGSAGVEAFASRTAAAQPRHVCLGR
jgi:hypothetical protein